MSKNSMRDRHLLRRSMLACLLLACLATNCLVKTSKPPEEGSPPSQATTIRIETAPNLARIVTLPPVLRETGSPMQLTANDGTGLALRRVEAEAVVGDVLATTELRLLFENPTNRRLEGRFRITLPSNASVVRFAMRINGLIQDGEVVNAVKARHTFEDFLHINVDPALIEHAAGNELAARVFPIEPQEQKLIILGYVQQLLGRDPLPIIPLRGLPTVDELAVRVVRTGQKEPWVAIVKKGAQPSKDIEIEPFWRTETKPKAERSGSYVAVRTRIPETLVDRSPDPISSALFLIDTSASEARLLEDKLDLIRDITTHLATKSPETQITIVCFDQEVVPIFNGAVRDLGEDVLAWARRRQALGASNLGAALAWATEWANKSSYRRLFLFSNGVVTAGMQDATALGHAASGLASAGVERIDAIHFGRRMDQALLKTLVTAQSLRPGTLHAGEQGVERLLARLEQQTAPPVHVEVPGASFAWPQKIEGVLPNEDVIVMAKLTPELPVRIALGKGDPQVAKTQPSHSLLLGHALAQARIESLIEEERRIGPDEELAKQIVDLAVTHRVLTPYTSLLVLETEGDYARYGIDRKTARGVLTIREGRHETQRPIRGVPKGLSEQQAFGTNSLWRENGGADKPGTSGRQDQTASTPAPAKGTTQGSGRKEEARQSRPPAIRMGTVTVIGRVPPEVIRRVVRQNHGRFRQCYQRGLLANPVLKGRVTVRFVIGQDGTVVNSRVASTELPPSSTGQPHETAQCIARTFFELRFPALPGGNITVTYPLLLNLEGEDASVKAQPLALPQIVRWNTYPEPPPQPKRPKVEPHIGQFAAVSEALAAEQVDEALARAGAWRSQTPGDPLALIALGESLEAVGARNMAARAYGSLIDLFPDRVELRRTAAARLERLDNAPSLELALDSYEKARAARPDHPHGQRALAYALLASGQPGRAFEVLEGTLNERLRTPNFPNIRTILMEDMRIAAAAWGVAVPREHSQMLAKANRHNLVPRNEPSVHVVLSWETDASDLDLVVLNEDLRSFRPGLGGASIVDGIFSSNIFRGFGPEAFWLEGEAIAKDRRFEIYVHQRNRGPAGWAFGSVQIVRHDGKGRVSIEQRPFVIQRDDAYAYLGVLEVAAAP